jgi:hypothetical protein
MTTCRRLPNSVPNQAHSADVDLKSTREHQPGVRAQGGSFKQSRCAKVQRFKVTCGQVTAPVPLSFRRSNRSRHRKWLGRYGARTLLPMLRQDRSSQWLQYVAHFHRIQFSTRSPRTRLNSRSLFVARRIPRLKACAAISRSIAPIGWPDFSRDDLISPYASAAAGSKAGHQASGVGWKKPFTLISRDRAAASQVFGRPWQ